ncbi:MAG: hypothetical protein AAFP77_29425 [Bacteroidota bacterium]
MGNALFYKNDALSQVHLHTPFVGPLNTVPTPVEVAAKNHKRTDSSYAVAEQIQQTAQARDRKIILISAAIAVGLILLFIVAIRMGWLKL